jgi:two-component sensor histidine kinase
VTDQLKAEARLLQSSERLRLAARAAALTYITLDIQAQKITRLDNFQSVMGFEIPDETSLPLADEMFLAHVHPDDRVVLQGHVAAVHKGVGPGQIEFRVVDESGAVRWIECRSHVEVGSDGKPRRVFIINSDVTSRKSTELQLQFATRELMHRSKNLLSVIQGIAQISARTSGNSADFVRMFSKRVEALSRSQDMLVHGASHGVAIRELIVDQLSIAVGHEERARLEGPSLTLSATAAQSLGLAIHELATNSLKHGALSNDTGLVHIAWGVETENFVFLWRETEGPTVTIPVRTGFGRTIIERVAPSKLGGKAILRFDPIGVEWELVAPLQAVIDVPKA